MSTDEIKWDIESRLRVALAYAGYRHSFFVKMNVFLCVVALASLWLSGYSAAAGGEVLSLILNIVGSVSLIADVALNLKGCVGFWESMYDGYNALLAELKNGTSASRESLEDLQARMYLFDGRSRSTLRALLLVSRNRACEQLNKPECMIRVPWYQFVTANFFSWDKP